MSSRRLLDAVQLLDAVGSVAAKHWAVRQRQLDVYTRTSSLTKGLKSQTDSLVLAAQAAAALARRLNEPDRPGPPQSSAANVAVAASQSKQHPSASPVDEAHSGLPADEARKVARQSEFQVPALAAEHAESSSASISISPQQDVFYERPTEVAAGRSGLPRVKVPQAAASSSQQTHNEGKDHIGADVYDSPVESQLREDTASQLFRSAKVRRAMSTGPAEPGPDAKADLDAGSRGNVAETAARVRACMRCIARNAGVLNRPS